ncbi:hypothetical protein [Clavibacter zhangzhiyongii]|uniref:hypothetical protein n=1 Tax=Clavibacter zhangzhiyongii TaxID=2768071 RepID=UPI0039E18C03
MAIADELTVFVGIDSSVPDQPGRDAPAATDGLTALRDLWILRVLDAVGGDAYAGLPYDEATKEQMRLLATRNATAPTVLDEMDRVPEAFASVSGETFPADLPVLLFVVPDAAGGDGWLALHEAQAVSVERGAWRGDPARRRPLPASHQVAEDRRRHGRFPRVAPGPLTAAAGAIRPQPTRASSSRNRSTTSAVATGSDDGRDASVNRCASPS